MKKLIEIQQNLKAPKNQWNGFGKYNYRNLEDILEAVKPMLGTATLIISDEMVAVGDRVYVKATVKLKDGNETVEAVAYAREALSQKGMNDSQLTGATSSYARKYAMSGLFLIDDNKDADSQPPPVAENKVTSLDKKLVDEINAFTVEAELRKYYLNNANNGYGVEFDRMVTKKKKELNAK